MGRSINKIILVGNFGADPDLRETKSGTHVASFSLATSRRWRKQNGDEENKTEWHRCVAWNGAAGAQFADIVEKFGHKGLRAYVEGRMEYRSYKDRDGKEKWVSEIVVQEFVALDGREEDPQPADPTNRYQS